LKIIDVHNHLLSKDFDKDRIEVIRDAKEEGVEYSVSVSETYQESVRLLEYSKSNDFIKPCLGIHPANFEEFSNLGKMVELIRRNKNKIVGIGEVGLDYWRGKTEQERKSQRIVFVEFIKLAKEINLPLNVHSRSSGHYVIDILKKYHPLRVCLHAFDGKSKYALEAVERGYYFSIPPSVVFSEQKMKLVKNLPLEYLLAETDAPALAPIRRTRNELKNITKVIEKISEIKKINIDEVCKKLRENTNKLFKI